MTPADGQNVTEGHSTSDANVRRVAGIAALRRTHGAIADRGDEKRILRKMIAPVATLLMIVIAALIWYFGSPDDATADSPQECSPPASERITT